jgi:hypothetical protein
LFKNSDSASLSLGESRRDIDRRDRKKLGRKGAADRGPFTADSGVDAPRKASSVQEIDLSRIGNRRTSSGNLHGEPKEGIRRRFCVLVGEGATRPLDAVETIVGPNPEERSVIWEGKPQPVDESWHRRMYDVNKELADDLSRGVRIVAGRFTALTTRGDLIGKE